MEKIASFTGEHRFLSNFYPAKVRYAASEYDSVEHAYQAAKCATPSERKWFKSIAAGEAKKLGRQVTLRKDWESVKIPIMRELLIQKFSCHSDLLQKLLDTGNAELIEGNTWGDTFWGVCRGKGRNMLGKLLMEVRAELREDRRAALFAAASKAKQGLYQRRREVVHAVQWHPGMEVAGVTSYDDPDSRVYNIMIGALPFAADPKDYGWCPSLGAIVRDGNWVITYEDGQVGLMSDKAFNQEYEKID